jgi:bacteriorhodopsin
MVLEEFPIFLFGLLLMGFFAIWFFVNRKRNDDFRTAFLVSSITTLSYLLLMDGTIAAVTGLGEMIFFSRWLFYIASCSLLMLTIARILRVEKKSVLSVLFLNGLVMFAGASAALLDSPYKWLVFLLGAAFFAVQLYLLFEKAPNSARTKMVRGYIVFGWALFPVVLVFAPEGFGVISNMVAAALYLILDFFTKIVFYLHLEAISGRNGAQNGVRKGSRNGSRNRSRSKKRSSK